MFTISNFTPYSPSIKETVSRSCLCTMKLQGMADSDTISPHAAPAGMLNDTPVIEDISTSVSGILKLLQNLKPGKAADRLKPFLLKQLRE